MNTNAMISTTWMNRTLLVAVSLLGACAADTEPSETAGEAQSAAQTAAADVGLNFASTGDPHEVTGDGYPFDNEKSGTFTALKSYSAIVKDGSPYELMMMKQQQVCYYGNTCNVKVAIYAGGSRVKLFADGSLWVNGAAKTMTTNQTVWLKKPDGTLSGASLTRTDPAAGTVVLTLTSPVGDVIVLNDYTSSGYIDITGTISSKRTNERMRGSLGCFDSDSYKIDDLCKRFEKSLDEISVNGQETFYPLTAAGVDAFTEAWRSVQADCAMANLVVDAVGHCSW
jgi:hypothetical protein